MGILFIIGTPIGNLDDITLRAIKTLKEVDFVICEDTRRTKILLDYYKINKPLISYHQHSKIMRIEEIIAKIESGKSGAMVSDAGTPGVADPGGLLVQEAIKAKIDVRPIPGVSAVTAIISVSGWNTDKFLFLGYLPKKKGRQKLLNTLKEENRVVVIFESPERIERTIKELYDKFGSGWEIVIGRELTKIFEEIIRGKLDEAFGKIEKINKKGEFVICLRKM